MQVPAEIRLIGIAELCATLGRSRASIYRYINKDPAFPRQFRIGGSRSVLWRMADVMAYIDQCASSKTSPSHLNAAVSKSQSDQPLKPNH